MASWMQDYLNFEIEVEHTENVTVDGKCTFVQEILAGVNPDHCSTDITDSAGAIVAQLTGNESKVLPVPNSDEDYTFVFTYTGNPSSPPVTKKYNLNKGRIRVIWKDRPGGTGRPLNVNINFNLG